MRVANLDMTDPTQQCPDGFKLINRTEPPLRTCGRPDGHSDGCVSTKFPVHGMEYSRVCTNCWLSDWISKWISLSICWHQQLLCIWY